MKKLTLSLFLAFLCVSLYAGDKTANTSPPDETSISKSVTGKDMTDGGFFVHLTVNIPSMNYGWSAAFTNTDSKLKYGLGGGLELGNMFKISDVSNNALGVKATWLSAMYSSLKLDDTTSVSAIQGSLLRVGPYFTIDVNDNMAIDVFYTAGATILILADAFDSQGLGLTHNLGVGYRMDVLSVGFDFNFGKVKDLDAQSNTEGITLPAEWFKYQTTHMRFFVGVKI